MTAYLNRLGPMKSLVILMAAWFIWSLSLGVYGVMK